MKNLFKFFGFVLIAFIGVCLFNTFTFKSKQVSAESFGQIAISDSVISHLQQAIRFKTISYDDSLKTDSSAFFKFHDFLKNTFPLVFEKLKVEKINQLSLLLHWKGKSMGNPIVLMAHQDVVPVEDATRNEWKTDPFSGNLIDGFVYGRGAIDDKGSLMAILESTELLLANGFVPEKDIYLAFGHDEEINGKYGAKKIVEVFKQRNITPEMVLDEGGMITDTKIPNLKKTAAVIGIAEKGYVTVNLKLNIEGGHSSMPERNTAIDGLAEAIVKIKRHPFPAELGTVVNSFLDYVGPEMPFTDKMAMANRWVFSTLIKSIYSKTPAGNASIRTTNAFTQFHSGVKENLIPGEATATVNLRTLPHTSDEAILDHLRNVVSNPAISIEIRPNKTSPKQIADVEHPTFKYLQKTIAAYKKDIIVAPFLMIGATDGRYFGEITPQVFRFVPFKDLEGLHGVNERISTQEYKEGIGFYYHLIKDYR